MTLRVPLPGGTWSTAVAMGRVWVRNAGAWVRVRSVSVGENLSTGSMQWTEVYRWPGLGPALVAPTGVVLTFVGSTEVRLVVDNRFETWRLLGTVEVYTGGAFVSSVSVNVLADLISLADPGVVNGEVRFTVQYTNPDTGLSSPTAVFSQFLGLEA
jgi:hypothetical protein